MQQTGELCARSVEEMRVTFHAENFIIKIWHKKLSANLWQIASYLNTTT